MLAPLDKSSLGSWGRGFLASLRSFLLKFFGVGGNVANVAVAGNLTVQGKITAYAMSIVYQGDIYGEPSLQIQQNGGAVLTANGLLEFMTENTVMAAVSYGYGGTPGFLLLNGGCLSFWPGSITGLGSGTAISPVTPGVLYVTGSGPAGFGWMQTTGCRRVGTPATNATATMSSLSNLSVTLIAGRKYSGTLTLSVSNSAPTDGWQLDFNGGSATMTSVEFGYAGGGIGATFGTIDSTALSSAITVTTATAGNCWYQIPFTCVCNAAGTLIPRFASLNPTIGTVTVNGGGFLTLDDMVN